MSTHWLPDGDELALTGGQRTQPDEGGCRVARQTGVQRLGRRELLAILLAVMKNERILNVQVPGGGLRKSGAPKEKETVPAVIIILEENFCY